MTPTDYLDFFQDTNSSRSKDGGIFWRPSFWVNIVYVIQRVLVGFVIGYVFFWIYPRLHPPMYFLLIALLPVLFSILKVILRTRFIEYEVNGDKLIFREGFISRHMGAVNIARIQNTEVRQNIIERLFGIGTVTVNTDDSTTHVIWMIGMKKPDRLRAAILDASEAVRKSRGIYEFVRP